MSQCLIILIALLLRWSPSASHYAQFGVGGDLLGHSDGDVCPAALVLTPLIMSSGQQEPGLALHDIHYQIIVDE